MLSPIPLSKTGLIKYRSNITHCRESKPGVVPKDNLPIWAGGATNYADSSGIRPENGFFLNLVPARILFFCASATQIAKAGVSERSCAPH
jgi:hypothetical protein